MQFDEQGVLEEGHMKPPVAGKQTRFVDAFESKFEPQWWWGVADQTKPTAPWWDKE